MTAGRRSPLHRARVLGYRVRRRLRGGTSNWEAATWRAMERRWRAVDRRLARAGGPAAPAACPLCGSPGPGFVVRTDRCRFRGGRLTRHRCPDCGVVFGPQKMLDLTPEELDAEYRELYSVYREGATEYSVLWTFSLLDPRPSGRYLDFGCGPDPAPLRVLQSLGLDVGGFDPVAAPGDPLVTSDWDALEEQRFDGIITHNVLEHLVDPVATTRHLAGLLTPGGRLIHATECFDEVITDTRFHLFFFTGRSPAVLAERAGLRIVGMERGPTTAYTFAAPAPGDHAADRVHGVDGVHGVVASRDI
ncbi:MAG: class I SAM-dependent methyltransferase [Actinomycetota bacterium]